MYALVFLGFLACASAAPHYRPNHHQHHEDFSMDRFYGDSVFDAKEFWAEFSQKMSKFDQMMEEFMSHFPRSSSTAGFKDNKYTITIEMDGFSEKDIVVKARVGLVMVQAVQKNGDGGERSYIDVRNLPEGVSPAGQWTYEQGILKIVLPLNKDSTTQVNDVNGTPTEAVTEVATTAKPKEREEIESQEGQGNNMDADVGLENVDAELLTNEVSRQNPAQTVEATTYAVDVRNNFDFVPVKVNS